MIYHDDDLDPMYDDDDFTTVIRRNIGPFAVVGNENETVIIYKIGVRPHANYEYKNVQVAISVFLSEKITEDIMDRLWKSNNFEKIKAFT